MRRDAAAAAGGIAATIAASAAARAGFDAEYQAEQSALIGEPVAFALAVGLIGGVSFLASSRRWPMIIGLALLLPTLAWALASAGPDGFMAARPGAWALTTLLCTFSAALLVLGWLAAAALIPTRRPNGRANA